MIAGMAAPDEVPLARPRPPWPMRVTTYGRPRDPFVRVVDEIDDLGRVHRSVVYREPIEVISVEAKLEGEVLAVELRGAWGRPHASLIQVGRRSRSAPASRGRATAAPAPPAPSCPPERREAGCERS